MEARVNQAADVRIDHGRRAGASSALPARAVDRWGQLTGVLAVAVTLAAGLALVPRFAADVAYQNAIAAADVASLDKAEVHLKRALSWTPQDAYLQQFLGEIYYRKALFRPRDRQASLEAALVAFERSARLNPHEARTFTLTGWTQLYRGDAPAAERAFMKAKELDPNSAYVRYSLGTAYLWQRKLTEARSEMMFARRYLPDATEVTIALREIDRLEGAR